MHRTFMNEGQRLMKDGSIQSAGWLFEDAVDCAGSADEKASALQMQGVTQRLLGELDASMETFKLALSTTYDTVLKARITRDLGMTYLDQGELRLAGEASLVSYTTLTRCHELVEAAMSRGFQGRVALLSRSREMAIKLLREADKVLAGGNNRDYELNNLIWLMRASFPDRFTGLPRAIRLVKQTGQSRRRKELVVIVIGGDWLHKPLHQLYRLLRKHR